MKILKMIITMVWVSALLLLSACGDSNSSHVASWSDATQLSSDTLSRYPQMATDDNGNIIAVWAEPTGFYANRYIANSGWATPQKVGDAGYNWYDFRIAANRSGHAIFAWLQNNDTGTVSLHLVRYDPSSGWGPEENLTGIKWLSDVAMDDLGDAFIVADQIDYDNSGQPKGGITVAISHQAEAWSYSRIEYIDTSTYYAFPRMTVNGLGNGFLVWGEGYNSPITNVCQISPNGLGTPMQISSMNGMFVNIAVDDEGNAMALWGAYDTAYISHTYACRYTPAVGWSAAERIDNSPFDTFDQFLSVDPRGNFHAIWAQTNEGYLTDIYSCSYTPDIGWQAPSQVATGGFARYPRGSADASGNLFAAWLQYNIDGQRVGEGKIYVNRLQAGSGWGKPQLLVQPIGEASAPLLTVVRSGRAMVLWSQSIRSVDGLISYGTLISRFE